MRGIHPHLTLVPSVPNYPAIEQSVPNYPAIEQSVPNYPAIELKSLKIASTSFEINVTLETLEKVYIEENVAL